MRHLNIILNTIAVLIGDIALEVDILAGNVDFLDVVNEAESDLRVGLNHSLVGNVSGGRLDLGLDLLAVDFLGEGSGINIFFLIFVGGFLLGLDIIRVEDVLKLNGGDIVD